MAQPQREADYTAKSGTLTFSQTAAGVADVHGADDQMTASSRADETFKVSISNLTGGGGEAPTLGTSSVTTTITDDDDAPTAIMLSCRSGLGRRGRCNDHDLGDGDSGRVQHAGDVHGRDDHA